MKKIDAVFEGGGVKGIAFVGAISCIEDMGYKIENFAGTSVGAIIASLLAVGYKGYELRKIVSSINYKDFLDADRFPFSNFIIRSIRLFKDKGIYSGDSIENYMEYFLIKKGKSKFKDVSRNGKSYLKIIASDITNRRMLILPDDIENYGIDPMEFEISKAVRMSISMPIVFKPVILKHKNKVNFIVDGGILSNYPIWIFDVKGKPRWPTFGFKLDEGGTSYTGSGKRDLISYLLDILNSMIDKDEEVYVKNKDKIRTISIPTLGVGTLDFKYINKISATLFQSGYKSTEKFLRTWDFERYKMKYR